MAKVKSLFGEVRKSIDRKLRTGMRSLADRAVVESFDEHTQVIEEGPPFLGPHSSPGEFPHVETGTLAKSIAAKVSGRGATLEADIGVKKDAPYAEDLVASGRLGVEDAFVIHRAAITKAFEDGASR